ncbi:hypothetical protein JTE90_024212 [Oedothorax gibbosus]|uniref:Uncharacterized protein n=1 Tax=Oedothorax gibbosus TaxID=931172 RepID=A0AAV6U6W4_9ARAC|nr:hypothetical protein JTE90_024212 [Oedothorax gibbosus]
MAAITGTLSPGKLIRKEPKMKVKKGKLASKAPTDDADFSLSFKSDGLTTHALPSNGYGCHDYHQGRCYGNWKSHSMMADNGDNLL